MSLRNILVVLDGSSRDDEKLTVAFGLAARHAGPGDVHVTGQCVLEQLLPPDMTFALGGYPDIWAMPEFSRQIEATTRAKAGDIEVKFRDRLRREGGSGEWLLETGSLLPSVLRRGRVSDVIVMGQADPNNPGPGIARNLLEDVLMASGRPLLLVPYAGQYPIVGSNVLIGWSGTRESARAVHDALPLMVPGAKVTVLTAEAEPADSDTIPTAEIADHLARHGFAVSADTTVLDDQISPADALLGAAADSSADLLVVGGYGHSRTREMILGGVTRDLLRHMTLPVLMSH